MPAKFIPDMNQGPGHGIIIAQPIICQTDPSFVLYRSSDKLCLSPNGWQSAEVFLQPKAWDCHEHIVRLAVDESVVNHLDKLNTYRLIIKDDFVKESFTLVIEDIIHNGMDGGFGLGVAPNETQEIVRKVEEKEISNPVPAQPAPVPVPEPEPQSTLEEKKEEPKPAPVIMDDLSLNSQKKEEEEEEESSSGTLLKVLFSILVLLLIAAGIFWWYLHQQTADPKNIGGEQNLHQPKAIPDKPKPSSEVPKPDDSKTKDSNKPQSTNKPENSQSESQIPINAARALLRKNASAEESQELARSFEKSSKKDASTQDAIFLLYEDAAQKGLAPSMTKLGSIYDPSIQELYGSLPADLTQAHAWYKKALQTGDEKAQEKLDALKKWTENAAKEGNRDALFLLNNW